MPARFPACSSHCLLDRGVCRKLVLKRRCTQTLKKFLITQHTGPPNALKRAVQFSFTKGKQMFQSEPLSLSIQIILLIIMKIQLLNTFSSLKRNLMIWTLFCLLSLVRYRPHLIWNKLKDVLIPMLLMILLTLRGN